MSIPFDKTFSQASSSRASVKVKIKYQGHIYQKKDITGTSVFHKNIKKHVIIYLQPEDYDEMLAKSKLNPSVSQLLFLLSVLCLPVDCQINESTVLIILMSAKKSRSETTIMLFLDCTCK